MEGWEVPKQIEPKSPAVVNRLRDKPGLHAVGGVIGLFLQVSRSRRDPDVLRRSWVLRATIGSRRRDVGLGSFPTVTLEKARERAREARDMIDRGEDPIEARRQRRVALIKEQNGAMTFADAAERVAKIKSTEFKSARHIEQWINTIRQHANPKIGNLPVADVDVHAVLRALEPLWTSRTETATRLRGRIESVLAWATVNGYRTGDNPARWRGNLDAALPKPGAIAAVEHFAAVPVDDMPDFMAQLRQRDGMAAKALEFAVLTAARSGAVRGARWDEIDLEAGVWTIPAERMKGRRHATADFRVPLSDDARALLRGLPRDDRQPLIFPAPRGGAMSDMAMAAVLKRMGVAATVHGFRSTFKDWVAERTAYANEVSEAALAHSIGSAVERAYRRGDLFEKRSRLMRDWAGFCAMPTATGGKIVAIGKK
ncbi:MAG: integrase arm-type DNA-binding domain-containing protein [Rhodospirillaceae bacterium]